MSCRDKNGDIDIFRDEWQKELAKTLKLVGIPYDKRTELIALLAVDCFNIINRQAFRVKLVGTHLESMMMEPIFRQLLDAMYPVGQETAAELIVSWKKQGRDLRRSRL